MISRIGRYEIRGELGRGGMGRVLRAWDPTATREVAIKLLLASPRDQVALERLKREGEALARLRHPHVVTIHEVGEAEQGPYLVLDLVPGRNLAERLERDGPLPTPEEAARIARDLADALEHAHRAGVLHRDVKPGNVILSPDGAPHLTDFGLARELEPGDAERLSLTGQFLGTPGYMPPEQAQGRRELGPAADIYGLGATLYHMLAGSSPHAGASLPEVLASMLKPVPPPSRLRAQVPGALDAICLRCLAKDPADRYPDAAALRADLQAYLAGAQEARASRAVPLALGLVLLGALAAVALLVLRGSPAPAAVAPVPAGEASPAAGSLPAPPPGWRRVWGASGVAGWPDPAQPELWEQPGRVAAPLAAVRAGRGLGAAFLGQAEALPGGRVRVVYDLQRALIVSSASPGQLFEYAPGVWGHVPAEEGYGLTAPNDANFLCFRLGSASWEATRLSFQLEQLSRRGEGLVDGAGLRVGFQGLEGRGFVGLALDGRLGRVALNSPQGHASADQPALEPGRWVDCALDPTAPPSRRVVLGDRSLVELGQALSDQPLRGSVIFALAEHHLALRSVVVEGRPLRTDLPALARALDRFPANVRVAARFAAEPGEPGGPLVVAGPYGLELDGDRLVLSERRRELAAVSAPLAACREGWLVLERRADVLRGRLTWAGGELELTRCEPRPALSRNPGVGYGSTGPRVVFAQVAVHEGPADPRRSALDRPDQAAAALEELSGLDDAHSAWRRGACLLAQISDPAWGLPRLSGKAQRAPRAAQAAEAGQALERAASGLRGVPREDAWARAVLAWVVAGDDLRAAAATRKLLDAAGSAGRARAALNRLVPVWHGDLVDCFREGYCNQLDPAEVRTAASGVLLLLDPSPAERGDALDVQARVAFSRGDYELAMTLDRDAERQGADPVRQRVFAGEILLQQGRPAEALEALAQAHGSDETWVVWRMRSQAQRALGQAEQALVSALGVFQERSTPDAQAWLEEVVVEAQKTHPGLAAACLAAVAVRAGREDLRGRARRLANVASAASLRELSLGAYARVRLGKGADRNQDVSRVANLEEPAVTLLLASVGDASARRRLKQVAEGDLAVLLLARLDPQLRELLR